MKFSGEEMKAKNLPIEKEKFTDQKVAYKLFGFFFLRD